MRLTETGCEGDVAILSLDWEALGRYVRKCTLEAVAIHFATIAASGQSAAPGAAAHPPGGVNDE
jgi:hypothetical protein